MTTQDTENQIGGAEPQEDPPVPETPATDVPNPYEALKDQALKLIIRARQLGKDPLATVQTVLTEIAD